MKILSRVIDRVKSVYQYEKTTRIDAGAIQNVMIIFVIVMMLINIQNFRLGEYFFFNFRPLWSAPITIFICLHLVLTSSLLYEPVRCTNPHKYRSLS